MEKLQVVKITKTTLFWARTTHTHMKQTWGKKTGLGLQNMRSLGTIILVAKILQKFRKMHFPKMTLYFSGTIRLIFSLGDTVL